MPDVSVGVHDLTFFVTGSASAVSAATGVSAAFTPPSAFTASAATIGRRAVVTHFSGSIVSTVAVVPQALFTIESPAGTVIWQKELAGANATANTGVNFNQDFDPGLKVSAKTQAVVFRVASVTGTANVRVNGGGYTVQSAD